MKKQWVLSVAVLLLSLIFVFPAHAKVVYVKTDGLDTNDGSSWELAKQTVQAGLNAAVSGDEVWVAAGTYVGCITLVDGVKLYGGFTGNETSLSERPAFPRLDPDPNESVLDGNRGRRVVTSPIGATTDTRIDGFTICNGMGTNVAGIYCLSSSPTIANNTITHNYGYWNYENDNGGGIYCSNSSPIILNNTISANVSPIGGGIYCWSSSPTILNNVISGNISKHGSAIYCTSSSSPTISDNIIMSNSSEHSAAGIYSDSSLVITGNTIINNNGQGINILSGTITNNIISGNGRSGSVNCNGGGIFCGSGIILNNIICGNYAENGGGIYCYSSSSVISNNIISGNTGIDGYGGGIYCDRSAIISNNTIVGNYASQGGGIHCDSADVSNNIIAFNSSGVSAYATSVPTLRYNCIYNPGGIDYSGLLPGLGDISVDPKLVDLQYGNVHLQPDSPCIDAGDDSIVQPDWLDMDSEARIQGTHVDIGADESDGTEWPIGPYIIVRVSPNGDDVNDGSSWELAKKTVQAGINAASSQGGEVWVAAGTYNERIILRPNAYLYGRFVGTESMKEERNHLTNTTILDGSAGGSVVTARCGYLQSIIDGFTIRNGKAKYGGGIYCAYSTLTISNNVIESNSANSDGGGIYCSPSVAILNNNIHNNIASDRGGGICCVGPDFAVGQIISNDIINNNQADTGGGIYCFWSSQAISNNTIIRNNAASNGGGIYFKALSPKTSNNIIAFNSSGIYREGIPLLRNNCIYNPDGYDYAGYGLFPGEGDISADPLFRDLINGNYHLRWDSPCINAGWNDAPGLPELDIDGEGRINWGIVDIGADEYWPMKVEIDIKPGESPNCINPKSKGLVPVAILSTSSFDAALVDPSTVTFAGACVAAKGPSLCAEMRDVNGDGYIDLLLRFDTQSLILAPGVEDAQLIGRTFDGEYIEGTDNITIAGMKQRKSLRASAASSLK